MPLTRDALIVATGVVGTTLAPWGLAFIQSYTADKKLTRRDLTYERIDVISGAVLTGIIGLFVVIACAATLFATGKHNINDARDAAIALKPLAGRAASALFGFGLVGAALLAAAIVPLSTAYSVSEAFGRECKLDDKCRRRTVLLRRLLRDSRRQRRSCRRSRRSARARALRDPGRQRRSPPATGWWRYGTSAATAPCSANFAIAGSATRSRSAHSPLSRSRSSLWRSLRSSRLGA